MTGPAYSQWFIAELKRRLGQEKTAFYRGFEKAAGILEDWAKAGDDVELESDNVDKRVDPRELSEWQGPEAWFRGNP